MASRALLNGGQHMLATNKGKLLSRFTFAYEEPNVSIAYIEKIKEVEIKPGAALVKAKLLT